jgi:hypothetical protein
MEASKSTSPRGLSTMARPPISLSDTGFDMAVKMSEGNPGALSVITKVLQNDPEMGIFDLLNLDDMNIRGSQIWVAYKDHCGEDLEQFLDKTRSRDAAMVETVNRECGSYSEKAVTAGGSNRLAPPISSRNRPESSRSLPGE